MSKINISNEEANIKDYVMEVIPKVGCSFNN